MGWKLTFTRLLNDCEVDDVGRLFTQLDKVTLVDELEDTLRWTVTTNGLFSVKPLHLSLISRWGDLFPRHLVWMTWGQPKICFFTWEAV